MYKDIEEIKNDYEAGLYTVSYTSIPKKLPENYIFDEDLTVKQNKAKVIEYNKTIDLKKKEFYKLKAETNKKFTNDIIDYITNEYNFSVNQSSLIEAHVYEKEHAFMDDYFFEIDNTCMWLKEFLACNLQ